MRKTKIVCTLGPSTDREGVLREMIQAGMNVARFNFSHGTHAEHKVRLDALKALREELDAPVAAMLDTKGPEVRLKNFAGGSVTLQEGQEFTLTVEDVEGDATRCAVTYAELPQDVKAGDTILLDDGLVRLTVLSTTASAIRCRVENGGVMKDHKGVNVPGVSLSMPYMSQQDREDILFGMEEGFDFIAASFVRSAADVRELRKLLESRKSRIRIIAKIENQEGINNLTEILAAADGIMVARGDMGVEIDFTEIPAIQKNMIAQCVAAGKPVITATQMLDSMIENPRPTRAENTDELVELAVQSAEKAGLIRHGDLVVITAGVPVGISGTTNMIRIQQVGGSLVNAVGIGSRTASGPLCVCRSVEEVAEKFHAGDVLVVPYTTNELLPYLRDAAAIICEEGSAECHAATVGLLLSKPVLVGAGDATRRLEDGVRVSVDCARGVVQTMPQ